MGRKKRWTERILLPLAMGTVARIDAVLEAGETRLDLVRAAVDRELRRRERERRKVGGEPAPLAEDR